MCGVGHTRQAGENDIIRVSTIVLVYDMRVRWTRPQVGIPLGGSGTIEGGQPDRNFKVDIIVPGNKILCTT